MTRLSWPGWLVKNREGVNAIRTHPRTNRARCRITTLIVTNTLPLHQTATVSLVKCVLSCRTRIQDHSDFIIIIIIVYWSRSTDTVGLYCSEKIKTWTLNKIAPGSRQMYKNENKYHKSTLKTLEKSGQVDLVD